MYIFCNIYLVDKINHWYCKKFLEKFQLTTPYWSMISSLLHLVGLRPRVYYTLTNFKGGGQGPLGPPSIRQCIQLKIMCHLYGFNDTAWCWFKSYLDNRHTKVRINDSLSSSRVLVCSVPQGSVLGARLYSMFIYPFSNIIKRHGVHYHCYVDDIQIYVQCKDTDVDIQASINRLQNCILEISNCMMVNSLKINGDKTEFIIVGSKPAT